MAQGKTCHFKLVLLGDTAVGKSCLVVRFVRDEFFEFQEPTIGGMFVCVPVSEVGTAVALCCRDGKCSECGWTVWVC